MAHLKNTLGRSYFLHGFELAGAVASPIQRLMQKKFLSNFKTRKLQHNEI